MTTIREAARADASAIALLVNRAYRIEDFFVTGDRTWEREVLEKLRENLFPFYRSLGFEETAVAEFSRPQRLTRETHLVLMTRPL